MRKIFVLFAAAAALTTAACNTVAGVAEDGQAQAADALEHRAAVQPVAVDRRVDALLDQQPGALPGGVEHAARLGVVVEPARTPVGHHLPEVERNEKATYGDKRAGSQLSATSRSDTPSMAGTSQQDAAAILHRARSPFG